MAKPMLPACPKLEMDLPKVKLQSPALVRTQIGAKDVYRFNPKAASLGKINSDIKPRSK